MRECVTIELLALDGRDCGQNGYEKSGHGDHRARFGGAEQDEIEVS